MRSNLVRVIFPFFAGLLALYALLSNTAQAGRGHQDLTCAACHTSGQITGDVHASVPVWNPVTTGSTISDRYRSPTLRAYVSAPDGSSLLCLSCHDGSNSQVGSRFSFGPGSGLGSLANSHPISFTYDSALASSNGHLVDPSRLPKGVLDENGKMQCASCHDPHVSTSGNSNYLRWRYDKNVPSTTATFCRQCHNR